MSEDIRTSAIILPFPGRPRHTKCAIAPTSPVPTGTPSVPGADRLRITVTFPPRTSHRLRSLKDALEAPSYADVLRRSVAFYGTAVEAQQAGGRVYIEDTAGGVTVWATLLGA